MHRGTIQVMGTGAHSLKISELLVMPSYAQPLDDTFWHGIDGIDGLEARIAEQGQASTAKEGVIHVADIVWTIGNASRVWILASVVKSCVSPVLLYLFDGPVLPVPKG